MASDDAPEQSLFGKFFGRSVPAYLWIAVFYLIYVLVIAVPEMASSVVGGDESTQTAETARRRNGGNGGHRSRDGGRLHDLDQGGELG